MSQTRLAEAMREHGIAYANQSTVSRVEIGERAMTYVEAEAIAAVLDIPVDGFTEQGGEQWEAYSAGYTAALRDLADTLQQQVTDRTERRGQVDQ